MNIQPITRKELYYDNIIKVLKGEEPEPMKLADIEILFTQSGSGTPSPTNIRPISGYADANLYVSPAQDAYIYNIALLYGKNKFDKNMTFKIGYLISADGKDTPNSNYIHSDYIAVKPSTDYVFSGRIVIPGVRNSVAFYDKDKTFISRYLPDASQAGQPAQFKTPNNCAYIIFNASNASYFDANTIQLEEGTVATSYEEPMYVYSGHVDLISGLLTVDAVVWTRNSADMDNANSYPGWKNSGLKALGITGNTEKKGTLNVGEYYGYNTTGSNDVLFFNTNRYGGMNQNAWKALAIDVQIIIPLPTPQTYQLTPQEISTLKGNNVIWSDANGDTTITYMAKE